MKIFIKNQRTITEENLIKDPHFIISIFTPGDIPPIVSKNENTLEILQVSFPDSNHFEKKICKQVAEFIFKWSAAPAVVCQCAAGISRSAGVAVAIARWLNQPHDEASLYNPPFHPNIAVYKALEKELLEKKG